ncbi:hypothetical protein BDZ89DRAFT_1251642, partial [Hymenopellis radicata]
LFSSVLFVNTYIRVTIGSSSTSSSSSVVTLSQTDSLSSFGLLTCLLSISRDRLLDEMSPSQAFTTKRADAAPPRSSCQYSLQRRGSVRLRHILSMRLVLRGLAWLDSNEADSCGPSSPMNRGIPASQPGVPPGVSVLDAPGPLLVSSRMFEECGCPRHHLYGTLGTTYSCIGVWRSLPTTRVTVRHLPTSRSPTTSVSSVMPQEPGRHQPCQHRVRRQASYWLQVLGC